MGTKMAGMNNRSGVKIFKHGWTDTDKGEDFDAKGANGHELRAGVGG